MQRRDMNKLMVICLWALVLLFEVFENILYRNLSISEPIGYYLALPYLSFNKDDLVMLCIADNKYKQILKDLGLKEISGECPNGLPYLLKRIKALKNDTVEIVNNGVRINGVLQPNSQQFTEGRGVELNPLPVGYKHKLAEDEYFVLGNSLHSVDSRYFGIIKKIDIFRKAYLIYKTAD